MPSFPDRCRDLVRRAERAGWEVRSERPIPYGRMFVLSRGGGEGVANLNCYEGKKGFRFVTAGRHGDELSVALGAAPSVVPASAGHPDDPFGLGLPRIGGDESGKGDYFGPLVVAAYAVDRAGLDVLTKLGVSDSKGLSDARVERLAGELDRTGRGQVVVLPPRAYNPRYAEIRNVNTLLAELYGECITALRARLDMRPQVVLIDQFARHTRVLGPALDLPSGCRLVTRTKGEADPAVAAASILARAAFVAGLRELSNEFGQELALGAGDPVIRSGRAFVRAFGAERLADVAKLHFATTKKLR